MTTPIDTVREALERVLRHMTHGRFDDDMEDLEWHERLGQCMALRDTGCDLLEAMEKHGFLMAGDEVNPDAYRDWAHTLAQSYARRVGEVVG